MISAIILVPDHATRDVVSAREAAVRSLGWLVSAVVSGVVRDVTLAASVAMDLSAIADKVGCRLVTGDGEGERLKAAAEACRCERVLVLAAGFQPIGGLAEEIDLTQCRGEEAGAVVLRTPETFFERLFPERAAIVGIVTSRRHATGARSFGDLVRQTKGYRRLHNRVQPIP